MSEYAYFRALRMGLIDKNMDKSLFQETIEWHLGIIGAWECDRITSTMSDNDFKELVELVKKRIKKIKEGLVMYA